MARCGRCGLWNKYPDDHHEQKWAGVCMWYQHRLIDDDVWEHRECSDFFERIPGLHPMDHFDYKLKRDNLGDAYTKAKSAQKRANIGLVLSVTGILLAVLKFVLGVING